MTFATIAIQTTLSASENCLTVSFGTQKSPQIRVIFIHPLRSLASEYFACKPVLHSVFDGPISVGFEPLNQLVGAYPSIAHAGFSVSENEPLVNFSEICGRSPVRVQLGEPNRAQTGIVQKFQKFLTIADSFLPVLRFNRF